MHTEAPQGNVKELQEKVPVWLVGLCMCMCTCTCAHACYLLGGQFSPLTIIVYTLINSTSEREHVSICAEEAVITFIVYILLGTFPYQTLLTISN